MCIVYRYTVFMLQPTLAQPEIFSFWLKLLHVLLLLPLFLAWLVPSQPKVDGTFLYFALGTATTYWHMSSLVGPVKKKRRSIY